MNRQEKLSPHFTLGELIFSDTAERKGIDNTPSPEIIENLQYLCEKILEPIRVHFNRPMRPNSGYRSIELNKEVGGSAKSQHCKGEAVDIEVPGVSNFELAQWVKENLEFDQLILECYRRGEPTSGWVHVSLKQLNSDNRHVAKTYSNRRFTDGLIA